MIEREDLYVVIFIKKAYCKTKCLNWIRKLKLFCVEHIVDKTIKYNRVLNHVDFQM